MKLKHFITANDKRVFEEIEQLGRSYFIEIDFLNFFYIGYFKLITLNVQ